MKRKIDSKKDSNVPSKRRRNCGAWKSTPWLFLAIETSVNTINDAKVLLYKQNLNSVYCANVYYFHVEYQLVHAMYRGCLYAFASRLSSFRIFYFNFYRIVVYY